MVCLEKESREMRSEFREQMREMRYSMENQMREMRHSFAAEMREFARLIQQENSHGQTDGMIFINEIL